ncbi:aminodeoxychorismate synthase component I [bacterium]|nr:MAG: aminodeoxychorismate synthase component I [bacterium]
MLSDQDFLHRKHWETLVETLSHVSPIVVLESQDNSGDSYLACFPKEEISIRTKNKDEAETQLKGVLNSAEWHFGYISYDFKNIFEKLDSKNNNPINLPHAWFINPGLIIKKDPNHAYLEVLKGDISMVPDIAYMNTKSKIGTFTSSDSKDEYIKKIRAVQHDIRQGRYYELNLSRLLLATYKGNGFTLYKAMKEAGPVPMAAFIQTKDWVICSASPEVYLIKKENRIESRPIKGTRKRYENPFEDQKIITELKNSDKEKAENLMIVDLVRNDFNRVAKPGTVQVESLFEVHSYATVHQMESVISAQLNENVTVFDVIKASFPMGSMTGAPKIEAMKAIDEYENYQRNVYSGAIGFISPKNDAVFNVVIRTAIIQNETLYYGVGGAITSDSSPEEEWNETEIKAKALKDAVNFLNSL